MSFGATISGRSEATESNFDETVRLRYDPDLEAFVEKRFGQNFVVRLSAQNLLDRVKYEDFRKYDGDTLEEILENEPDLEEVPANVRECMSFHAVRDVQEALDLLLVFSEHALIGLKIDEALRKG